MMEQSEHQMPQIEDQPERGESNKVWTGIKWGALKVFSGLEYAGECVADALGLNDSQYQWAIDEYMRRQEEEEEERKEQEALRAEGLSNLEEGAATV